MADNKKMSVEEILAAARAEKAGGPAPAKPKAAPTEQSASQDSGESVSASAAHSETAQPAPKPAAKPAAGLSVAEMLAAARAEKSGGAKPAVAPKPAAPKAEPKPAAATATATKAPPKPAAATSAAPAVNTASILAAARSATKPGPVSKTAAPAAPPKPAKPKLEVPPMPAKPAYARPAPSAAAAPTRRGFFATVGAALTVLVQSSLALGFTSMAVTGVLWVLGFARFMFPNVLIEPPTKFKVGFPDDYAPGQVQTKFIPQFGVWVVRYEYEGQPMIYAIKSVCTHLGCTPNWLEGEQKFKCPCHGSGFYKDGINFEGPAPRPLERYAISTADDGQLEVDKSRTFQEELGQWKDGASFVIV